MEHGLCINTQIAAIASLVTGQVTAVTGAVLIMQWGWEPYFTLTHYQQQVADAHLADTGTGVCPFSTFMVQSHGKTAMKSGIQAL